MSEAWYYDNNVTVKVLSGLMLLALECLMAVVSQGKEDTVDTENKEDENS